jgi:hypothetical protein
MERHGNEEEGFEVNVHEAAAATIRVRAWGFWSQETAGLFVSTVVEACRPPGRIARIIIDALGLKPQREVGQEAFGLVVASLRSLGVTQVSVTTDSPLTKLQLLRISKERAQPNSIEFIWHLTR